MEPFVDARYRVAGLGAVDLSDTLAVNERVVDALAAGGPIVVVGDDATLGAIATTYYERLRDPVQRLEIVYLASGPADDVATHIDASTVTSRALRRASSGRQTTFRRVPTLRVVDTAEPRATIGFTLGVGALVDHFVNAGRLRRRDLLRPVDLLNVAVTVDWAPYDDEVGYLLATALPRCWGGVAMGDGLTVRIGRGPTRLLQTRSRVGTIVERARGVGATSCNTIHIDGKTHYLVDGMVVDHPQPRTIAVTQGPSVLIATV